MYMYMYMHAHYPSSPVQVGTPATVPFATIFLNLSMTVLVPLILGQVRYITL